MTDTSTTEHDESDAALAGTVESWLAENWDPTLSVSAWWERVADAGWTVPHFPVEWGGRGLARRVQPIVRDAFRRAGALCPPGGLGLLMAAPTILSHGTPEQIERLVPPIVRGQVAWCQLFSEPGAGSDLAGLRTRATRDGDRWIISGQKVWSSQAMESDYGMLLARTDFDRPKHAGISWFAFRLDQPGVTIRPLREATGHAIFNEVFFDDDVVDDADLIGGEGNGWRVTQTTLLFERTGIGAGGSMAGFPYPGPKGGILGLGAAGAATIEPPDSTTKVVGLTELIQLARRFGRNGDPIVRQKLAQLAAYSRTGEWMAQRARADAAKAAAGGFANLGKLAQTRILKLAAEIGMDLSGPAGTLWSPDGAVEGRYAEALVFSTASSIYGGTDQVQRNVIGERALGLPREPSPDRDQPFAQTLANAPRENGA
jgi:alkylation response protein AidB-like acyl-CoA dehydrogenase